MMDDGCEHLSIAWPGMAFGDAITVQVGLQLLWVFSILNKSAQSNLGRGPCRCESVPRGGLITTAKVVAGEFITPH